MLDIDFPDREYELGGRIDVSITLRPHRDIRIRHARVDVLCNQTYTHHSAWEGNVPASVTRARSGAMTSGLVDVVAGGAWTSTSAPNHTCTAP